MSAGFGAPEGFRIEDDGPVLGAGCWHFGSIILLILGGIFAWIVWPKASGSGDPQMLRRLVIAVFVVCAIPMSITILQVVRLKRRLGNASLFIPHGSLPLGFTGTATYVRPLRGGAAAQQIEARLQCEEEIVKGHGKHKSTRREIVYDEPLTLVTVPGLNELRVQIPLKIPAGGPASLSLAAGQAQIRWWVRLRLRMQGCPNTRSSFEVDVMPLVVER